MVHVFCVLYLNCSLIHIESHAVIMPWWAEPWRHNGSHCVSVCPSICISKSRFSTTLKIILSTETCSANRTPNSL